LNEVLKALAAPVAEVVALVIEALAEGVPRDELVADMKARITAARVAASEARMREQLGNEP
jgi:hypothetical protein